MTGATDRPFDLVLRADRAVLTGGAPEARAVVGVRDGRVAAVASGAHLPAANGWRGSEEVRLRPDEVLVPGFVDNHVHVNEPGRTQWEGFATATRAAAAGGITTILDMPLNSIPPTIDVDALTTKQHAAEGQCHVDVGFWGGAVPGHLGDLAGLHRAGVFGFKCFLLDSGVPEFPPLPPEEFLDQLAEVARLGALMIVHAEDPHEIASAPQCRGPRYADFLASRPRHSEERAIVQLLDGVRRTGARAHLLHLADGDAVPLLQAARAEELPVSVETCPHYLTFAADQIADGRTEFKCCPPIREDDSREALWAALADGTIDIVASDHSPSEPTLKNLDTGDFGTAWGGIAGLQLSVAAVWTGAAERGHPLGDLVRWMSTGPAELAGLRTKGEIAAGADADLVAFAPDETQVVDAGGLRHRHRLTPYDGLTLRGVVRTTWLRGAAVTDRPTGRFLQRGHS